MTKFKYKLSLLVGLVLLLTLIRIPDPVYARWPPFVFKLTPAYENGKITYHVDLRNRADWAMTDITLKFPLPAGTRYFEGLAQPGVDVKFDGQDITFFAAFLHRDSIRVASFVVEVIDPATPIYTTSAWISWKGDEPGIYETEDISINISKLPLNWVAPSPGRLQLKMTATVTGDIITYSLYPENHNTSDLIRMQDLEINIPVPEGTTFLSAEPPPHFTTSFNGSEVNFATLEVERKTELGPPKFTVSTEGVSTPVVVTHAWATWKNAGRSVGKSTPSQEEASTGDLIIQPGRSQFVVSDDIGDVPFPMYDLTSVAFQEVSLGGEEPALKLILHFAHELDSATELLNYNIYFDLDCRVDTGRERNELGVEYRLGYWPEDYDSAALTMWNQAEDEWDVIGSVRVDRPVGGKLMTLWAPRKLFEAGSSFCWGVEIRHLTEAYAAAPPAEWVPDTIEPVTVRYQASATATFEAVPEIISASSEPTTKNTIEVGDVWQYWPGWAEPASDWNKLEFDDGNWFSGPTPLGYGLDHLATDVSHISSPIAPDGTLQLVQRTITQTGVTLAVLPSGDEGSIFMRRLFTLTDPSLVTHLALEIDYLGGFIAYLNGVEVARRGLGEPGSPVYYDSLAADQELPEPETIELAGHINDLVAGTNSFAVQMHRSANTPDLSINLRLTAVSDPAHLAALEAAEAAPVEPAVPLTIADIGGKLAVPIDNGRAAYDVHVFSLPDGQELVTVPYARQPNLRFDGQRMLLNREGSGIENVFEYNFADGGQSQVTDAPQDWHPFYSPGGDRVVYGNAELTNGSPEKIFDKELGQYVISSIRKPFLFVQCGLTPPHLETESRCHNIPWLGVLVPAGQTGEIQGTHPVWTTNEMIAYRGCNTWAGSSLCGIFIVPAMSTKGFSDGFIPRQLSRESNDTPSDTKGNLIAFTSQRDGNFEAYVMDLNGQNVRNLSNSPGSNDGLPTISPDQNWAAFISDRTGRWAIWVVPTAGGSAQKLFDLPSDIPWGSQTLVWMNERLSWGP
jgi:hypothetical protein